MPNWLFRSLRRDSASLSDRRMSLIVSKRRAAVFSVKKWSWTNLTNGTLYSKNSKDQRNEYHEVHDFWLLRGHWILEPNRNKKRKIDDMCAFDFLNWESTCDLTDVQAPIYDRKTAARCFDASHDIFRYLSLAKYTIEGRNAPIWHSGNRRFKSAWLKKSIDTAPTHFYYLFRTRKQRNKSEWIVTKMSDGGFTASQ